jgi:purine nucleosidase
MGFLQSSDAGVPAGEENAVAVHGASGVFSTDADHTWYLQPVRIWIDTDIGTDVDDALTLAYVLRHPGFELVGVSTVFGDVSLRARIAEALLAKAGAPHVPVVPGLGVPLTEGRAGLMLGHEGVGILDDPAPRLKTEADPDPAARVDALAGALAAARPDVLLAIGPLTDLGALAAAGVALPPLAIMGGKLEDATLEGMLPGVFEWNWFCDPAAARSVLALPHATLPRVVPADVTFRTALAAGDVERLAGGDGLARALARLCEEWLCAQRDRLKVARPRVMLHDPLTAAVLVEPGLCPCEPRRIRVEDTGALTPEPGAPNLEIALDVDADALRHHLMRTLCSGDAVER